MTRMTIPVTSSRRAWLSGVLVAFLGSSLMACSNASEDEGSETKSVECQTNSANQIAGPGDPGNPWDPMNPYGPGDPWDPQYVSAGGGPGDPNNPWDSMNSYGPGDPWDQQYVSTGGTGIGSAGGTGIGNGGGNGAGNGGRPWSPQFGPGDPNEPQFALSDVSVPAPGVDTPDPAPQPQPNIPYTPQASTTEGQTAQTGGCR